jgi:hypothetical protein
MSFFYFPASSNLSVIVPLGQPPALNHNNMTVRLEPNAYLIPSRRPAVGASHQDIDHFTVPNHRIERPKPDDVADSNRPDHQCQRYNESMLSTSSQISLHRQVLPA